MGVIFCVFRTCSVMLLGQATHVYTQCLLHESSACGFHEESVVLRSFFPHSGARPKYAIGRSPTRTHHQLQRVMILHMGAGWAGGPATIAPEAVGRFNKPPPGTVGRFNKPCPGSGGDRFLGPKKGFLFVGGKIFRFIKFHHRFVAKFNKLPPARF